MNLLRNFTIWASTASFLTAGANPPAPSAPEAIRPQPIPGTFEVLEQHSIRRDGRTITYCRITPPKLTEPQKPVAKALTSEEQAITNSRKGKAYAQFSVGATVYDHQVTEIHWSSPNCGKRHLAYSNIDFNLVAGLGTFDSVDTVYSTLLAVGNATRKERDTGSLPHVPALTEFPKDLSVYLLPADDTFTEADNATLTALDALHTYYDANRAQLQQAYEERESQRLAQQQWAKDHPPVLKDETFYLWKKEPALSRPTMATK